MTSNEALPVELPGLKVFRVGRDGGRGGEELADRSAPLLEQLGLPAGIPTVTPTASALAQARRRVGAAPLRWFFDLLRGPTATPRARDTRPHGWPSPGDLRPPDSE